MKNGDIIRSFTDEELALYISKEQFRMVKKIFGFDVDERLMKENKDIMLNWLKEER